MANRKKKGGHFILLRDVRGVTTAAVKGGDITTFRHFLPCPDKSLCALVLVEKLGGVNLELTIRRRPPTSTAACRRSPAGSSVRYNLISPQNGRNKGRFMGRPLLRPRRQTAAESHTAHVQYVKGS